MLFPSVEDVTVTLWEDLFHGSLLAQTLSSLGLIGLGLVIALVLAFFLSLMSLRSPFLRSLTDTLTAIAHPLPGLSGHYHPFRPVAHDPESHRRVFFRARNLY